MSLRGFHSRGYLPHLDNPKKIQAVTFRLADTLPKSKIEEWKSDLERFAEDEKSQKLRVLVSKFEDSGAGECLLRHTECARAVRDAMLFNEGNSHHLLAWCIMPNHVHAVLRVDERTSLGKLIKSWKQFSANRINELLERSGQVWAVDYFDRYIRDEEHLARAIDYVHRNPVKAGLCQSPEIWRWSSAGSN